MSMSIEEGLFGEARRARDRLVAEERGPQPPGSLVAMFVLVVIGPVLGAAAAIAAVACAGSGALGSLVAGLVYLAFLGAWTVVSYRAMRREEVSRRSAGAIAMLAAAWTTVPWLLLAAMIAHNLSSP